VQRDLDPVEQGAAAPGDRIDERDRRMLRAEPAPGVFGHVCQDLHAGDGGLVIAAAIGSMTPRPPGSCVTWSIACVDHLLDVDELPDVVAGEDEHR
jgi:hypothetical protein